MKERFDRSYERCGTSSADTQNPTNENLVPSIAWWNIREVEELLIKIQAQCNLIFQSTEVIHVLTRLARQAEDSP